MRRRSDPDLAAARQSAAAFELAAGSLLKAANHLRKPDVPLVDRHAAAQPHIRAAGEAVERAVKAMTDALERPA